jgi:hypothetical protein
VEHCDKHGQYHADYICGECVEDLKKERDTLNQHVLGQIVALNSFEKECDVLQAALEIAKNQLEMVLMVGRLTDNGHNTVFIAGTRHALETIEKLEKGKVSNK